MKKPFLADYVIFPKQLISDDRETRSNETTKLNMVGSQRITETIENSTLFLIDDDSMTHSVETDRFNFIIEEIETASSETDAIYRSVSDDIRTFTVENTII